MDYLIIFTSFAINYFLQQENAEFRLSDERLFVPLWLKTNLDHIKYDRNHCKAQFRVKPYDR